METEVEHDFIRQSQRGLNDTDDYFVGGSAFPDHIGTFIYTIYSKPELFAQTHDDPQYSSTQTGNVFLN